MNMQPYLEQYLDNLENLSPELTRNFKLVYELDSRVQDTLIEIDALKQDYLVNLKSYNNETRLAKAKEIDQKYEKCKELSDEKVQMANQTYELVDKYIRRLDIDLARFEVEKNYYRPPGEMISQPNFLQQQNGTLAAVGASEVPVQPEPGKKTKSKKKVELKAKDEGVVAAPIAVPGVPMFGIGQATDTVLDMPVDPNEPTYCLCRQVSYGEMIGCDNSECEIEWFHFGCVGLTIQTKPKGKWYCPVCIEKRKK